MPVIPAEIRRIEVQSQPREIVCETLYGKIPSKKPKPNQNKNTRRGGVTQGIGSEFKSQSCTHTQKEIQKLVNWSWGRPKD
jgi:hypothetical protein